MIVIRVELHSAVTGEVTELARMYITNNGTGDIHKRNYTINTIKGRSTEALNRGQVMRAGTINQWPSPRLHVWNLVYQALVKLDYTAVK